MSHSTFIPTLHPCVHQNQRPQCHGCRRCPCQKTDSRRKKMVHRKRAMLLLPQTETPKWRMSLLPQQETWTTGQKGSTGRRTSEAARDRRRQRRNRSQNFFYLYGFLNGRISMMQCPPIPSTCASVTVRSQTKSMQIPVQLIMPSHSMKVVTTRALVDSGVDISCID